MALFLAEKHFKVVFFFNEAHAHATLLLSITALKNTEMISMAKATDNLLLPILSFWNPSCRISTFCLSGTESGYSFYLLSHVRLASLP